MFGPCFTLVISVRRDFDGKSKNIVYNDVNHDDEFDIELQYDC